MSWPEFESGEKSVWGSTSNFGWGGWEANSPSQDSSTRDSSTVEHGWQQSDDGHGMFQTSLPAVPSNPFKPAKVRRWECAIQSPTGIPYTFLAFQESSPFIRDATLSIPGYMPLLLDSTASALTISHGNPYEVSESKTFWDIKTDDLGFGDITIPWQEIPCKDSWFETIESIHLRIAPAPDSTAAPDKEAVVIHLTYNKRKYCILLREVLQVPLANLIYPPNVKTLDEIISHVYGLNVSHDVLHFIRAYADVYMDIRPERIKLFDNAYLIPSLPTNEEQSQSNAQYILDISSDTAYAALLSPWHEQMASQRQLTVASLSFRCQILPNHNNSSHKWRRIVGYNDKNGFQLQYSAREPAFHPQNQGRESVIEFAWRMPTRWFPNNKKIEYQNLIRCKVQRNLSWKEDRMHWYDVRFKYIQKRQCLWFQVDDSRVKSTHVRGNVVLSSEPLLLVGSEWAMSPNTHRPPSNLFCGHIRNLRIHVDFA